MVHYIPKKEAWFGCGCVCERETCIRVNTGRRSQQHLYFWRNEWWVSILFLSDSVFLTQIFFSQRLKGLCLAWWSDKEKWREGEKRIFDKTGLWCLVCVRVWMLKANPRWGWWFGWCLCLVFFLVDDDSSSFQ